jgi:archaellum component FlaG (FlaF/FlaG flagellin family)
MYSLQYFVLTVIPFSQLLSGEPKLPTECNSIYVLVTGRVSWSEVQSFREQAKSWISGGEFGSREMTLLACGTERPIHLSIS